MRQVALLEYRLFYNSTVAPEQPLRCISRLVFCSDPNGGEILSEGEFHAALDAYSSLSLGQLSRIGGKLLFNSRLCSDLQLIRGAGDAAGGCGGCSKRYVITDMFVLAALCLFRDGAKYTKCAESSAERAGSDRRDGSDGSGANSGTSEKSDKNDGNAGDNGNSGNDRGGCHPTEHALLHNQWMDDELEVMRSHGVQPTETPFFLPPPAVVHHEAFVCLSLAPALFQCYSFQTHRVDFEQAAALISSGGVALPDYLSRELADPRINSTGARLFLYACLDAISREAQLPFLDLDDFEAGLGEGWNARDLTRCPELLPTVPLIAQLINYRGFGLGPVRTGEEPRKASASHEAIALDSVQPRSGFEPEQIAFHVSLLVLAALTRLRARLGLPPVPLHHAWARELGRALGDSDRAFSSAAAGASAEFRLGHKDSDAGAARFAAENPACEGRPTLGTEQEGKVAKRESLLEKIRSVRSEARKFAFVSSVLAEEWRRAGTGTEKALASKEAEPQYDKMTIFFLRGRAGGHRARNPKVDAVVIGADCLEDPPASGLQNKHGNKRKGEFASEFRERVQSEKMAKALREQDIKALRLPDFLQEILLGILSASSSEFMRRLEKLTVEERREPQQPCELHRLYQPRFSILVDHTQPLFTIRVGSVDAHVNFFQLVAILENRIDLSNPTAAQPVWTPDMRLFRAAFGPGVDQALALARESVKLILGTEAPGRLSHCLHPPPTH